MTLRELLGHVGVFGGAVMLCLAVLSFFSLAVIVEKQRRFRAASRQSQALNPRSRDFFTGERCRN